MSKLLLLHSPHLTPLHFRAITSFPSKPHSLHLHPLLFSSPSSPLHQKLRFSSHSHSLSPLRRRSFSARAFDTNSDEQEQQPQQVENVSRTETHQEKYPTGEFEFKEMGAWTKLVVKLRMLVAFPWERVRKGSVLTMKLRGQVSDQVKSRFSRGLSLPQICENFIKAAYDPRIAGVYLHIDSLVCGWGKVEEIRRHILNFKKSGKFVVGYVPVCREKEYYVGCVCDELYFPPSAYCSLYGLTVQASFLGGVFEKVGIQPEVQRIGKYKSAGDQLTRKTMSEENCEMLNSLLDNIYGNWLDKVSSTKGKKREDVENFINEGVYKIERLKEEGFITNIQYDDEVISMLKERLGVQKDKVLPMVDYSKYSRVRNWTLGLTGGKDRIAIIRASGSISRVRGPLSLSGSGIISDQLIEKIRSVRESKRYKAAIIRIDSPGGDALASDLMWREIRLLAASKPVIASMADVAASGGYYMAMAAGVIVAENLTLTGSIGVVTGKFNLGKLYEKIGFNKEVLSRGRFAELFDSDQRPLSADEAELFAKSAENAYKQFRDKAAFSRSMPVEKMEEVAQGRVWTGIDAASRGLVDALGGLSHAVAIAKMKANISQDTQGPKLCHPNNSSKSPSEIKLTTTRGGDQLSNQTLEIDGNLITAGVASLRLQFRELCNYSPHPTNTTQVKLFDDEPTNKNGLPNAVEEKPHPSHFQILDSVEYIDKQTRYEADYTQRLMAKYFSKKNLYGGDIFDEKTIDGETIMSSRWCCTQSFADPRKVFEEQSSNDSISASET